MDDMKINVTSAKGVLLKTEGKFCKSNITVVPVLEELTITESITATRNYTNAEQVYNFILSLMTDEERVMGIINTNLNTISYVNNQCIQATVYRDLNDMVWARWRDGTLNTNHSTNYQYDLIINAGDTFKKIVI